MVKITKLKNNLTLIAEKIDNVESVAISLSFPGGIITDPEQKVGLSLLLAELTSKGAGPYSSRELVDCFDQNGIRHAESAGTDRYNYSAALLTERLEIAIKLISLMIIQPQLPAAELDNIKSRLIQEIQATLDSPARKAGLELARIFNHAPYNRNPQGEEQGIEACSENVVRDIWKKYFVPGSAVLSIAGKFEFSELEDLVAKYFSDWTCAIATTPKFEGFKTKERSHLQEEAAQLQIALAYPSAKFIDPDYYVAKVATGILSGGMFGRLFTEVREKRGLCYSVYARHVGTKDYGYVSCYAGTTPERAHETLSVMKATLKSVAENITEDELKMVKTDILSSLVIAEESVSARAASNLNDYLQIARIRPLTEIKQAINSVSASEIKAYAERYSPDHSSLVTLGNREL